MDMLDLFSSRVKKRAWMDTKIFILGTVANLASIIDACISSKRYGIDLETSGLDNRVFVLPNGAKRTVDRIAGICLSPDGVTGYYIPIHHAAVNSDGSRTDLSCNISVEIFSKEFLRLIKATENGETFAVFHNSIFDQEFLTYNETGTPWGDWDKISSWDDTLIECYLKDSRKRDKRLKTLSEEILDIEQVHLDELFPPGYKGRKDFTTLDPTDQGVLWYACGDAICTRLLHDALIGSVLEPDTDGRTQKTVYAIEKGNVLATRWMQRNRLHINLEKVGELIKLGHKEWLDAILEVYSEAEKILGRDVMPPVYQVLKDRFVVDDPLNTLHEQIRHSESLSRAMFPENQGSIKGRDNREWPYHYDVNSPQQLGVMFDELDVPGLRKTEKSGQIKTSKDELDRIVEEAGDQSPSCRRFVGSGK
jgi:DNA polymerase I-like protein with 3'-5' exonuclease and polymerase domains